MKRFILLLTALLVLSLFCATANAAAPTLVSESAVLIDADTGQILYNKDMHRQMYPASITKILTVITGLEKLPMTETMTMSHYAVFSIPVGSSHIALDEGEVITMEQAVYAALLMSANDACNGIAERIAGSTESYAVMMNETAKRAGAINSNFVNPHGLFDENHYTTAYDMAMICRYALGNETFRKVFGTRKYVMAPTNEQPEERPFINQHDMIGNSSRRYEGVIGGKEGWTSVSKCTLVTAAERNGRTLIAVVMKCVKDADKYNDTRLLLDYGFSDEFTDVTFATSSLPRGSGYRLPNPIKLHLPDGVEKKDLRISIAMENGKDLAIVRYPDGSELGKFPCEVLIDVSEKTPEEKKQARLGSVLKTILLVALAIILPFVLFVVYIAIRKEIYRARRRRRRRNRRRY